jgi:hypothetical protein
MLQAFRKSSLDMQGWSATRVLLALFLFGVSFGYVEAAVVVYLRPVYDPLHERYHPGFEKGQLFPLLRMEELEAAGPEAKRCLLVELGREAATLVMLAAVALAVSRNFHLWFAGFVLAFGVWDLFYYVFLKLLLGWPASWMEWDLLFLLPVPWAGPVLAPILVALSMVCAGALVLLSESTDKPIRPGPLDWVAIVAGGLLIVAAFCWDCRNLLEGGEPNPFNWGLFAVGQSFGLAGFVRAWWKSHNECYGTVAESCAARS